MTSRTVQREIVIVRTFQVAPAELFRAWTEPSELDWFLNPDQPRPAEPITVDLRVGGAWKVPMVIDQELAYTTGGIYLEIVPNRRLVFAWGAEGGWPALDLDNLTTGPIATLELEDLGGNTPATRATLTLTLPEGMSEESAREWLAKGIEAGWRATFERLTLPG